jgi:alginate O-acetyltransferase complex protein AlgI
MLFNSLEFLVFFPLVTILYFILPHRYRWILLLISSCYFYIAFVPIYILILGFTIVIDYFAGIAIEKRSGHPKKALLLLSLVANIGILIVFKYYNFINENLSILTEALGYSNKIPFLTLLLPIGLSFHTFQAMSYTFEVYYGKQKAERHFGIYALYVMFYPQLVAGPIERPQNLLHQFYEKHTFDYKRVTDGLKLMAWGMFKKVVIADRLAIFVNAVYGAPENYSATSMMMATVFFSLQIYCDFSGYSDIAIGSAQVMGFNLMQNFRKPYGSKSISEFWGRWHISLSTWFRDYVYIPLGGNRVVLWRRYYNLFIVFLLSGIWHGANWTFLLWGTLHAVFLIAGLITKRTQDKLSEAVIANRLPYLNTFIHVGITFSLVTFAWIFFRAINIHEALYILKNSISGLFNFSKTALLADINLAGITVPSLIFSFFFIILLMALQNMNNKTLTEWINKKKTVHRWTIYYLIVLIMIFFGVYERSQFIYFQF